MKQYPEFDEFFKELDSKPTREEKKGFAKHYFMNFNLQWSAPKIVKGGTLQLETATPTQEFWDEWKRNKESLKGKGISVVNKGGNWQVCKWTNLVVRAEPQTNQPLVSKPAPVVTEIPSDILSKLLPHQPSSVRTLSNGLNQYNSVIDASDCGIGKTYQSLAAAKMYGKDVLVICPKAAIPGWQRAMNYLEVNGDAINYEMVKTGRTKWGRWVTKQVENSKGEKKDVEVFEWTVNRTLIFDEVHCCFPGFVRVRTNLGDVPISEIVEKRLRVKALSFNIRTNQLEWKPIKNWFKNPFSNLIIINHKKGRLICTESHKIWTANRGYVKAQELTREDLLILQQSVSTQTNTTTVLQSEMFGELPPSFSGIPRKDTCGSETRISSFSQQEAETAHSQNLCVLRQGVFNEKQVCNNLQSIVCGKLSNGSTRAESEAKTVLGRTPRRDDREDAFGDRTKPTYKTSVFRTNETKQPHQEPVGDGEDYKKVKGKTVQRERRQFQANKTSIIINGYIEGDSKTRTPNSNSAKHKITVQNSHKLQSGFSSSKSQDSNRSRWESPFTRENQTEGHKENQGFELVRVDSIEILEPDDIKRYNICNEGDTALYDIEVEGNHNYLADNILVSNCKARDSINAKILISAKIQNIPMILLSATAACSPLDMKAIGFCLGLFPLKNFWGWAQAHGVKKGRFGMEFDGNPYHLQKIHGTIFGAGKGIRLGFDDIPNFPDCLIISEAIDFGDNNKIQGIYDEMEYEIEKLRERSKGDTSCILTEILRARQRIELLKVPTLAEMTQDLISEGYSVPIFLSFKESISSLAERLDTDCIIDGENVGDKRERNRVRFQEGRERAIVCSLLAGGECIDLDDQTGEFPRASLLNADFSPIRINQAIGRTRRSKSKTKAIVKFCYASDTIEERARQRVMEKARNIELLNEGDLTCGLKL